MNDSQKSHILDGLGDKVLEALAETILDAKNDFIPHMHVQAALLRRDGVITSRTHLPGGRASLESVVRLLITELGWPPAVNDWDDRLTLSEGVFRVYSSWNRDPHTQ